MTYRNMINAGVSPDNFAATQRYVSTSKKQAGSDEWNVFETMINYVVPIVISLVLFIMIFAYGQTVAQSIATEKTSRVMELLLTSVRPLAVVIGKVLAMGCVSILQFLLIGIVGGISFAATAPFGIGGDLVNMLQNADVQTGENAQIVEAFNGSFGSMTPLSFVLIFVIFILGFLFYALIAALVVSLREPHGGSRAGYAALFSARRAGILPCVLPGDVHNGQPRDRCGFR